ncbi:MAG: hypothetical protein ABFD86_13140, partial [Bryobacteraceae bacterium]
MFRQTNIHPHVLFLLWFAAYLTVPCCAQTGLRPETFAPRGVQTNGLYLISGYEAINDVTGNLVYRVPIASMPPGRNGSPLEVGLIYNSTIYDVYTEYWMRPGGSTEVPIYVLKQSESGGWRWSYKYDLDWEHRQAAYCSGGAGITTYAFALNKLRVVLPDGSHHTLHPRAADLSGTEGDGYYQLTPEGNYSNTSCRPHDPETGTLTYYMADGSFIRVEIAADATFFGDRTWRIYLPGGKHVEVSGSGGNRLTKVFERNGNYVTIQGITNNGNPADRIQDLWGRSIIVEHALGADVVRFKGKGGQDLSTTVNWSGFSLSLPVYPCGNDGTEVVCNGGGDNPGYKPTSVPVWGIDTIQFPSPGTDLPATTLKFGYDTHDGVYYGGELNSVEMWCPDASHACQAARVDYEHYYRDHGRNLTSLTTGDDIVAASTQNPVWRKTVTYTDGSGKVESWQYSFLPGHSTITSPDGGETHHYSDGSHYGLGGTVYKTTYANGDIVYRNWTQSFPPWVTSAFQDSGNAYVSAETKVVADYSGASSKAATTVFTYNRNGDLKQVDETDVWSTQVPTTPPTSIPGGPTRTTTYVYTVEPGSSADPNDTNAYWYPQAPRHDLLSSKTVATGGTVRAYTEHGYDTDGNLTETRQWDDQKGGRTTPLNSSNAVVRSRTFEAHNNDYGGGNPQSETDGRGNTTTYSYQTSYPYPTSIVGAAGTDVAWRQDRGYDASTGLLTSETDYNNNVTTSYYYDWLGRQTSVAEAGMRSTSTSYDDVRRIVWTTSPLDANRSLVAGTTYDWLGRAIRTGATNDAGQHPA